MTFRRRWMTLLVVALAALATRRADAQASARPSSSHGAILVRVADGNDQPLWGGDIDLPLLDVHFAVPDGGKLLIKDVAPGTYIVQARRVGYAAQRRFVKVGDDTARVQFTMYPGSAVDTVKVTAFRDSWAEDFARHQKLGFGKFYNTVDILESHEVFLSTFLKRTPGLLVSAGSPDVVHSIRASGRCGMMQIYWDGMLMNGTESSPGSLIAQDRPRGGFGNATAFDINSIPLETIAGIEVYTDVAAIPALYASSRDECGAVFVWSK